ncbi:hypothetical protein VPH35_116893 [Triticum aestivum]|uniref:H(+)-transporting two-sector ATPase n=1 Tax=Triticum aestivum TaxID=4565 RepID=A0A3B6QGC1_WHEAT
MNEPPGARMRVGLTALTMVEYFPNVNKQDMLLFIDNIFRFVQAGSEVSALLGRMPSAVGYQPTLSTEMGSLQERIASTKKGSNFDSSSLCIYRRFDRPCPCHNICTFGCYYRTFQRISFQGYLSSSRSFRFNLDYATASDRWQRTL